MSARTILKHVYENGGMTKYQFDRIDRVLKERERPHGEWNDHSDEGYVECPFCEHATTCNDDIDELHYCFFCGAELRKKVTRNDNI